MKATELMVGDFVMMGKKIYRCANICGHTNDVLLDNGVITNVGNLCPIPLTPEILEKNDFKKCEGNEWSVFKYKDDDLTKNALYQVLWSADELYLEICSYTSNTGDFNRIGIRYVHELQHALKLCGINKTIEL